MLSERRPFLEGGWIPFHEHVMVKGR